MNKKDLTTKEVAIELGIHADTARDLLVTGKLKGYKTAGGDIRKKPWRVTRQHLNEYKGRMRVYNDSPRYTEEIMEALNGRR